MPSTPGEGNDGTVVVSLPVALPNPHATCPPEEDRQSHADEEEPAPEGERNGIMEPTRRPSLHDAENESGTESDGPEIPAKRMDEIDNVLLRDTPSPNVGIEDGRDHEARLAQSMSATALSPQIPQEWPSPAESPERVSRLMHIPVIGLLTLTARSCLILPHLISSPEANLSERSSQTDRYIMYRWKSSMWIWKSRSYVVISGYRVC